MNVFTWPILTFIYVNLPGVCCPAIVNSFVDFLHSLTFVSVFPRVLLTYDQDQRPSLC